MQLSIYLGIKTISVPLFDDIIRQEMDEWLYLVKNSRVKEDFKSPYMQKVAERLNVLMMSDEEREKYDAYLMDSMKGRDYLVSAEERGRAKGIEEGIKEGVEKGKIEEKLMIARNLLLQNIDINTIATVTGLSIAEIKELQ